MPAMLAVPALAAVAAAAVVKPSKAVVGRGAKRLSEEHHEGHIEAEWGGIFDMAEGTYKWSFCKTGSPPAYADAEVGFWAKNTDAHEVTSSLVVQAEENFEAFSESSPSHTESDVTLVPGTVYLLELEADQECTTFDLAIPEPPARALHHAIFLQHLPTEFEGSEHYLKGPDGSDVEPEAVWNGNDIDAHAGHDHGSPPGGVTGTNTTSGSAINKSGQWVCSILAVITTGLMMVGF